MKWVDRRNTTGSTVCLNEEAPDSFGRFTITVHNFPGHLGHEWFLSVPRLGLNRLPLKSKTLDAGKLEAIVIVQDLIYTFAGDLARATAEDNA